MASISVPCPKCSLAAPGATLRRREAALAPFSASLRPVRPSFPWSGAARFLPPQVPKQKHSSTFKAQASEAIVESLSNSAPKPSTKLESQFSDVKDAEQTNGTPSATASESQINAFIDEVSELVKLVDSRDIVELQLKQADCEIIIRKQEALPQPPAAPVMMMQGPSHAVYAHQPSLPPTPPAPATTPVSSSTAPPALAPAEKSSNSSLPPLKCPMAGTFYRCPAPGEPPFVKIGDKVKKGQIVCIIEAMKLMNEIEADQSGTVIDVVAEDGKPVSIDSPLLIIQP